MIPDRGAASEYYSTLTDEQVRIILRFGGEKDLRAGDYLFHDEGVGEGTGLEIVRRIVSAHGGEVSFESEPGDTRFLVHLPVKSVADLEQGS